MRRSVASSLLGVEEIALPYGAAGQGLTLATTRGALGAILHEPERPAGGAVLWVCGARGGYAGPAEGIYETLSEELTVRGVTSLRLDYRHPADLDESVWDALIGVQALRSRKCSRVALVGHSFGGAVVIATAAFSPDVSAVVALSSQTHGAQGAPHVSPRPLLIVHGTADTRLPAWCAQRIYGWAREPKELVLYEGAEHGLRECRDELQELLGAWLPRRLEAA
ncbi:MAG: dienelactone hydrolase family protein [Dehalococcoidia bacterium]|nr:dienelactone hydrolase family protein [Dehalococcoidia bacterium]